MDVSVSRKIPRYQPSGNVLVLVSNVSDLYPVFSKDDENLITDIEMLDDDREELLDQGMWAVLKQRGLDPLSPLDGNQYEECILGDITPVELTMQIMMSVLKVGPGVKVSFSSYVSGGREKLLAEVSLTNAV